MRTLPRTNITFGLLFGYILLQFLWWEILLVRQNNTIISEKQKVLELTVFEDRGLETQIDTIRKKRQTQTVMIVGEGTVFLLILLFGIYKIRKAQEKEVMLGLQQENFFLSITHELKTPIAAMKLQLQTLRKQKLDDATKQDLIEKALSENERLNTLIDNVLLASSFESGEYKFNMERIDLASHIEPVLKRYYKDLIAAEKIKMSLEPGLFTLMDPQALPSVITNLVDNAIKYSPQTMDIKIELKGSKGDATLLVSDRGAGIRDSDKKKIFDKFYRAGREETRSSRGTGLGLYIVDYILSQHGAKISVLDNDKSGSIFEIRFQQT